MMNKNNYNIEENDDLETYLLENINNNEKVNKILKENYNFKIERPKFIISKKKIEEQINLLKNISDEISYSWKTNPLIGKILFEKKLTSFSLHSLRELNQFCELNKFSKNDLNKFSERIYFYVNFLNEKDIITLLRFYELKNFVFDNILDLIHFLKIAEILNENDEELKNKIKLNIYLRSRLKEYTVYHGKNYVFGIRSDKIKKIISLLKSNKLINKIGLTFHRKTQNVSEWEFLKELLDSFSEDFIKNNIDVLNIGGGLPVDYVNIESDTIAQILNKLEESKNFLNKLNVKVLIEPGRFIAAPSVILKAQILKVLNNVCFMNISLFSGLLDTVIANIKLRVYEEVSENKGKKFMLKGNTPDSSDIIRYSVFLDNPKAGDILTFLNAGAYTYMTDFLNLEKIDYEVVNNFENLNLKNIINK